jgi:hypothetical protein
LHGRAGQDLTRRGGDIVLAHQAFPDQEAPRAVPGDIVKVIRGEQAGFGDQKTVFRGLCGKRLRHIKSDVERVEITIVYSE